LAAVKEITGLETAHFELARGSPQDNKAYCSKLESRVDGPYEWGDISRAGRGTRTDVIDLVKATMSGASDLELVNNFPDSWMRYHSAVSKLRLVASTSRREQTELHVLLGSTGLGKTTWILDNVAEDAFFKDATQWWDLYTGVEDVVIEEFYGWLKYDELLRLINPVPHQVQVKGHYVRFNSQRVWITSNNCPCTWYRKFDTSALLRRITSIRMFVEEGKFEYFDSFAAFFKHAVHADFCTQSRIVPNKFGTTHFNQRNPQSDTAF